MKDRRFQNEKKRAMLEAEVEEYMKEQYLNRKRYLLKELYEINDQLNKLYAREKGKVKHRVSESAIKIANKIKDEQRG